MSDPAPIQPLESPVICKPCHEPTQYAVAIYTDGAAHPNPGSGGFGVIIVRSGERTELSGGFRRTTNNRMEILAAIEGLKALDGDGLEIVIFSDSKYVGDMFNGGYAEKWRAHGWMRNKKDPALNPDLWAQLLDLAGRHRVRFEWVRGHNEHPENERCDQMAVEARQRDNLPADEVYEKPPAPGPDVFRQQTFWDRL